VEGQAANCETFEGMEINMGIAYIYISIFHSYAQIDEQISKCTKLLGIVRVSTGRGIEMEKGKRGSRRVGHFDAALSICAATLMLFSMHRLTEIYGISNVDTNTNNLNAV